MRNVMKAATLESKFPILSVEHDCIISKDADITVCYRVELPELFTVTQAEYEAIHSAWAKAVKVLPNYSIVHKQDFFIEESYTPELQKEDLSFLSRSFERHFNERPYLKHTCYLFLTKTTKEHSRTTSSFNALTRGFIIPKEMQDKEAVSRFLECCEQFERIINDSGFITLTRLTGDEITGTESTAGIIEKYFSLSQEDTTCLQDITLGAGEMKIGDNYLCLHTLSDPEDLPTSVATDSRYERLSTDRSDCRLSFAAPIGVLLTCNHIVNLLADATQLAIDKLSSNKKGFVLMVEGSQIDKGGHKNDQNYMISETLDFDRAVGKALDFAQKDKNTLVLITADHETGGVTVAEGHYGKKKVVVKFNTGWHTASPVPFFAYGPGAELFSGFKDNTAPFT